MTANPHIFIVAAEKSGDELGAKLVTALREQSKGQITLSAIGGSALEAKGLPSPVDISPLSILGFTEGLKAYPVILDRVRQTSEEIIKSGADAVVLIDSWGFMIRVAKSLKKQGYKGEIIKYVAPQVWAMREGRSKILAAHVDHLLTIHDFDAKYFTRHDLPTHYVGNPVFDEAYDTGDADKLRSDYNIPDGAPVLVMLFGSRLSEIQKLAAPFADAVRILKQEMPGLTIVSPVSDTISTDVHAAASEHPDLQDVILLGENRKLDCFAAATAAIACSGTVTTQLASAGVPTVVAYKLNRLTFMVARHLFKPNHISMVNIAANAPLMPEFMQTDVCGETLATAALAYLKSPEMRAEASESLRNAVANMRRGNTDTNTEKSSSQRAAAAVLDIVKK
jgi:lipid-A-disaccharide synthase